MKLREAKKELDIVISNAKDLYAKNTAHLYVDFVHEQYNKCYYINTTKLR